MSYGLRQVTQSPPCSMQVSHSSKISVLCNGSIHMLNGAHMKELTRRCIQNLRCHSRRMGSFDQETRCLDTRTMQLSLLECSEHLPLSLSCGVADGLCTFVAPGILGWGSLLPYGDNLVQATLGKVVSTSRIKTRDPYRARGFIIDTALFLKEKFTGRFRLTSRIHNVYQFVALRRAWVNFHRRADSLEHG